MASRIKDRIKNTLDMLLKVRAKHATWYPADEQTMKGWQSMLENARRQAEFADHPVMKKWIAYMQKSMTEINNVLLNDKDVSFDERRILIEKRELYMRTLAMFVPNERIVDTIESAAREEMQDDTPGKDVDFNYPQSRTVRGMSRF